MNFPEQHLTPDQISSQVQGMIVSILGYIDANGVALSTSGYNVRIGWPTAGAPAWAITDDVCFVQAIETDDDYDRLREVQELTNGDGTLTEQTSYTRVWEISHAIYGPNSFDHARLIRSGLFQQKYHDVLVAGLEYNSGLYLMSDIRPPMRAPELFEGQWWERTEFRYRLNELVIENDIVNAVKSVEVKIYTQFSPSITEPAADFTVVGE